MREIRKLSKTILHKQSPLLKGNSRVAVSTLITLEQILESDSFKPPPHQSIHPFNTIPPHEETKDSNLSMKRLMDIEMHSGSLQNKEAVVESVE
jgi:hypothetical protein